MFDSVLRIKTSLSLNMKSPVIKKTGLFSDEHNFRKGFLFKKRHLHGPGEVSGFDSVEVYTIGESGSIPDNRMLSSIHKVINQRINLLARNVVNLNSYMICPGNSEADRGGRVERIRRVLADSECRLCIFFNCDRFSGNYTMN